MFTLKTFLESKNIAMDAFKEMDAENQAAIFNELNEKNAESFKALKDSVDATKDQITKAHEDLRAIQAEQIQQLNSVLKAQGVQIKRLTGAEKEAANLSFGDGITKALSDNIDKLTKMKNGGKSEAKDSGFEFVVKAPGNMTIGGNVSGGNIPVEDRLDGFNIIPSRRIRLLDIMAQRQTASNVVSWVYQANKDGAAGPTGEGLVKNQIDFDLVVANETVKKMTAFIKVSTEMLDDITWIRSEIENELMRELQKVIESQAYSGDGTGNNMNGIRTVATAFSGAGFTGAAGVENPNGVDVLAIAMNQIAVAEHDPANYILMHPTDVTKWKLEKISSTDKRYVNRLLIAGSTLMVDGVPVIPTTLVTVGEYLIGNFNLSLLVTRTGLRFDIGLDADDFTKNLRTILGEWRGLTIVKNNDRTAFVKGVFATDITAITKTP